MARKKVEGMRHNILYSQEKEMRRAAKLYWKDYLRWIEGKAVDELKMNKRMEIARINIDKTVLKEDALEYLKIAKD